MRIVLLAAVWDQVLEHIAKLRQEADMINLFPYYLTGEDLFGFTEPAIQRVLESVSDNDNCCGGYLSCLRAYVLVKLFVEFTFLNVWYAVETLKGERLKNICLLNHLEHSWTIMGLRLLVFSSTYGVFA